MRQPLKKNLMMEKRGEDEKSTMGTLLWFKFTITFVPFCNDTLSEKEL